MLPTTVCILVIFPLVSNVELLPPLPFLFNICPKTAAKCQCNKFKGRRSRSRAVVVTSGRTMTTIGKYRDFFALAVLKPRQDKSVPYAPDDLYRFG